MYKHEMHDRQYNYIKISISFFAIKLSK